MCMYVCVCVLDRYLLISRPLRYSSLVTTRRVWVFIAGCWVWAAAVALPLALGLTVQPDWDGQCLAELLLPLWFVLLLTLLHFLVPFLVMLYVHVAIFVVARRQQRAVKESLRRHGAASSGLSGNRAKLRAARLLALPCGFFYVSWGPWFFAMLWAVGTGSLVEPHGLERFVQTLCILNSLGNPVLYAVSQPLLGRAMLAKVTALGKACRRRCFTSTATAAKWYAVGGGGGGGGEGGGLKPVETATLFVPDTSLYDTTV